MEDKKQKDLFDKIWDFFASVKLAVVLLMILALSSIVGTIVEQRAEPATNISAKPDLILPQFLCFLIVQHWLPEKKILKK